MHNLEWDEEHRLLKVKFVGCLREGDVPQFQRGLEALFGTRMRMESSCTATVRPKCGRALPKASS